MPRRRTSPVVVSSMPPVSDSWVAAMRSAPSSRATWGERSTSARMPATYASASSPRRPCTSATSRSASATSSCVENGLAAASATSAPPSARVRTSTAVSAVTCRHEPTRTPSSGRSRVKRSRIERRTGICPSAHSIRAAPDVALVAVMIRLEGPLDRDADVGGLVGRQLRQPDAERVEVQARDLLVEVLGQHVDALLVLVVLREQLDLGDRLVRERVRHHERRVARRVAEVQQAPLAEHDDRVAVGEDPLVDLRLDVDLLDARQLRQAGDVDLVVEVA